MTKFLYRKRPPFLVLRLLARYNLEEVDLLVNWSEQQREARTRALARLGPSREEQYMDEASEIDSFARLYAECAIIALWRCVELFRKGVVANIIGPSEANVSYEHKKFCDLLSKIGIAESSLRCAKSVNELRCLNNAAKHSGYVDKKLADLPRWRTRAGERISDLTPHYRRLRPLAERYIDDLTKKANRWWGSRPA